MRWQITFGSINSKVKSLIPPLHRKIKKGLSWRNTTIRNFLLLYLQDWVLPPASLMPFAGNDEKFADLTLFLPDLVT